MSHRSLFAAAAAAAVAALGPLCEARASRTVAGWQDPQRWLPDLLVGELLVLVAVATARRDAPARRSTPALLALAVAVLWFLGTAVPGSQLWHRGPLVHLLVTTAVPHRWHRSRRLLVISGYLAAVLPTAPSALVTSAVVLATVSVAAAARMRRNDAGRRPGQGTKLALALAWAAATVAGLALGTQDAPASLVAYEVLLCAVAAACALTSAPAPDVAGIVVEAVEVGAGGTSGLQQALRRAVQDDALLVGTWSASAGAYVDSDGLPLDLASDGPLGQVTSDGQRTLTTVRLDGEAPVVVVHAADLPDRTVLAEAVRAASRVAQADRTLLAALAEQAAEADRSRRRLVVTAGEERRALGRRLRAGPRRRLVDVLTAVEAAARDAPDGRGEHLDEAARHVRDSLADLDAVASGLHPTDLDAGLGTALRRVAARSPVPVALALDDEDDDLGVDEATALYYVASEALTNIVKHAHATHAWVALRRDGDDVVLSVRDDGSGGARPRPGGGLAGLADRLAALGGRLEIGPPDGGGTCVKATLPAPDHR